MATWPPNKDRDLLANAEILAAVLTATPSVYGGTAPEAVAVTSAVNLFGTKLDIATEPTTRTKGATAAKNAARKSLLTLIRPIGRRIQAIPTLTDQQIIDAGLPVHDRTPSPNGPPVTRPVNSVVGVVNDDVVTRARDEAAPDRRARPEGVAGLSYYSFVGENVPADIELWRHEGLTGKMQFTIHFNPADRGKLISIASRYYNARGEFGPLSVTVNTVIAAVTESEAA